MKLPSPTEMDLLTALGLREVTGREVAQQYLKETGKTISYGTLYTTMARLKDAGWIESSDAEDEDGRLRYFKLSAKGALAVPLLRQLNSIAIGEGVIA